MSFFTSLRVNGSALAAERLRVDLASANLANEIGRASCRERV